MINTTKSLMPEGEGSISQRRTAHFNVKWPLTPVLVMPENVIRVMESLQPFLSDSDVCRDDDQNGA